MPFTSAIAASSAARKRVDRPEVAQQLGTRAGPSPGISVSTVAMSRLRRWRWWVIANRCASSRTRWNRKSASLLRGRITGNSDVGRPDLLEPLRDAAQVDALDAGLLSARAAASPAAVRRRPPAGSACRRISRGGRMPRRRRRPRHPCRSPARRRREPGRRGRRAAGEHLVDGIGVVGGARDGEAAVLVLPGQAVFEDDHRGDDVGAARGATRRSTRCAVARRPCRAPPGCPRAPGSRREVGAAPGLVEHERLLGVLRRGLQERRLVAALRRAQPHLAPGDRREPVLEGGARRRAAPAPRPRRAA